MESTLYTSLGQIARAAMDYYETHGTRTDFVDIIIDFYNHNKLAEAPRAFRPAGGFLTPEDFRAHAYGTWLNASLILKSNGSVKHSENIIFSSERDVFSMVLVSHLNDHMHLHDYFEINYVYEGSYTQVFEHERRDFHRGHLIIIPPDAPHMVYINDDSLIQSILIRKSTFGKIFWPLLGTNDILSSFFKYALYENKVHSYLSFVIKNTYIYEFLLQKIFDESRNTDDYANNMAISYTNIFWGTLLREFGNNIHLYTPGQSSSFNKDFPLIMKYVQYNYDTVTLSVLSSVFHYSEVYLSKMFKKNLNEKFSIVVQNIRLEHARTLLATTDYRLEDIAGIVGYESTDYLTRIFKKKYNITPSAYRHIADLDSSSDKGLA